MTLITFPDYTKIAAPLDFIRGSAVSRSRSPYTFRSQVSAHAGKQWIASVSVLPMPEADLRAFDAFFSNLNGPENTFLLGPQRTRGGTGGGSILVNGATETGSTINVDGMTLSESGVLLAGDFCSIENRLYGVKSQLDADGSGEGVLSLWPNVRVAPADNATVVTSVPMGEFRLLSATAPSLSMGVEGLSNPFVFECEGLI